MTTTTYKVTWNTTFATDSTTFKTLEEAIEWAQMKQAMNYKGVKLEKIEATEIAF